jgi:pectinesterase
LLAPNLAHADVPFSASVGADAPGAPRYDTIAAALASAPAGAAPYRVLLGEGTHREKLIVDRANVAFVGASQAAIISCDTAAGMMAPDGRAWGTWRCATLSVKAPGFSASNLTIENAFDYVADLSHPQFERIGSNGAQAVALMLEEGSDRALFENVRITGHQDTLFANAGRGLFRNCFISGSVDFIFGAGAMYFDRCELQSRYRPLMQRNHGWVAVPSTARDRAYGLVFDRCRLTREAQVPLASVALGRPWRPAHDFPDGHYGDPNALGMAAFLRCWMDDHISADGWDEMGYAARDGARIFLEPSEARFGEYENQGPGAFVNRRRPQLRAGEARAITQPHVLDGWRG